MAQFDKKDVQQRLQKIEQLVHTIESSADPHMRSSAVELMQSLMELHGAGIERMMEIAFDCSGEEIIDRFADNDLTSSLLLLYGLHPLDLETRVMQALDKVRPYLQSHGGNVELLGITEGVLRLKLQGSCNGCASSAMTLKLAIEEAIYEAAPDVVGLDVEGVLGEAPRSGFVQLEKSPRQNGSMAATGNGWEVVRELPDLPQGAVRMIEVSGRPILFCRVGESFYAYDNTCPACDQAMKAARLETASLICISCGQHFDVLRAGRSLDKPSLHLEPFPLLFEHGVAKIALPAFAN